MVVPSNQILPHSAARFNSKQTLTMRMTMQYVLVCVLGGTLSLPHTVVGDEERNDGA